MTPRYDVFICHASEDLATVVDPLIQEMRLQGIKFWVDSEEMRWGDDLIGRVSQGLAAARFLLVIISASFTAKNWPQRELNAALNIEISRDKTRVLPLYVGTDAEIEGLRLRIPLLHNKLSMKWRSNAAEIVRELTRLLRHSPRLTSASLSKTSDEQYDISTAFWAGRYSESASRSQTILEMAIRAGDFDTAALALANLILINRNRNRFRAVVYLMQRYFQQIPIKKISPEYRYRLFKELFIYYHETDNFPRAMIYLDRLQRIDSSLMMYTPSDDWIPGIIRWRKAHLGWIMDPSGKSLMRSVAEAQEGVIYLQEALHENPNSAGLASAYLNVGWLYFIQDNPVCLDYFDQAVQNALDFSPRTEGQAMLAQAFAEAKFGLESHENALGKAFIALGRLAAGGYAQRSYAFLQKDREWKFVKYCLDLWVRMGNLRTG